MSNEVLYIPLRFLDLLNFVKIFSCFNLLSDVLKSGI